MLEMQNYEWCWFICLFLFLSFSVFSTLFMQNQMARALLQTKPYLPKGFYTTLRESLPIQPTTKRWEAIIQCWTSKLWQKTWNRKRKKPPRIPKKKGNQTACLVDLEWVLLYRVILLLVFLYQLYLHEKNWIF